ncbi:MAG TPA: hypothetical protein VJ842_09075 [Pyrinomonadaceae bacterium]|nr:hypothetical protein [Pyrinomonadaceae bacterium]
MTRKIFAVSLMLCVAALFAFAQEKASQTVKFDGYLIDNMCASDHAEDADFDVKAKNHTVGCALMPGCADSGFALVVGKKMYKLDEEGNKQALVIFAATTDKKQKGMHVEVEGTLDGTTLHATKVTKVKATE